METIQKINVIELASNLAERDLSNFMSMLSDEQYNKKFPNGTYIETEDEITYTEEAQDLFNEFYDEHLTIIEVSRE
jgi:phenylalanine-4-hydroxylase